MPSRSHGLARPCGTPIAHCRNCADLSFNQSPSHASGSRHTPTNGVLPSNTHSSCRGRQRRSIRQTWDPPGPRRLEHRHHLSMRAAQSSSGMPHETNIAGPGTTKSGDDPTCGQVRMNEPVTSQVHPSLCRLCTAYCPIQVTIKQGRATKSPAIPTPRSMVAIPAPKGGLCPNSIMARNVCFMPSNATRRELRLSPPNGRWTTSRQS